MAKLRDYSKQLLKSLTPPILYTPLRRLLTKKKYYPVWNTLEYDPLKGIRLFLDPSGTWQKKMINGSYDSFIFERLSKMDLRGKVIYDIGAHIGYHSLYFARLVGAQGKVISFEPNPENVKRFRMQLDANEPEQKIISLYEAAVSDENGTKRFMMHTEIESGRSMGNFLSGSDTHWSSGVYTQKGFKETEVKTLSLDSFLKEKDAPPFPDLMKIDVEGAEHEVLLGAHMVFEKKRPVLFIEVHSIENMFYVVSILNQLRYGLTILKKENTGICFLEAQPLP